MSAAEITPAERRALKAIAAQPLFRQRTCYRAHSGAVVSMAMAARLRAKGLAIELKHFGKVSLAATQFGDAIGSPLK